MTNYKLQTYSRGQAALTTVILLLFVSLAIGSGVTAIALKESRVSNINTRAKESYFLAESGVEDMLYRVKKNMNYDAAEILTLGVATATTTVTDTGSNEKTILAQGDRGRAIRNLEVRVQTGAGASFSYAVQVGEGGLFMENESRISGSVYSNGSITGQNSPVITGNATSAGTIGNPPSVHGTRTEQADPLTMPITDSQIEDWKNAAAAGGIISSPCPYKPSNGTVIGPKKIACDMKIDGEKIITLTGPLWIAGSFEIKNEGELRLANWYGAGSEVVVADNPANRTTSSKISMQNNARVQGSGTSGSYILLVSQNNSAELDGNEIAIEPKNESDAPIYYAPHGKILIQNKTSLKEATAYKIHMKNEAVLTYESGIAELTFASSSPSGGWEILDWREIK